MGFFGKSIVRAVLGLVAAATAALAAQAAVPNPTVTGPIPARAAPGAPSHDYPWMTTLHNLDAVGYVEEEFFFEGTARRFNTTPAGQEGTLRDSGHKYKTRLLVRRPKNLARFNGTVLAEWQNVTAGYDLDAMWGGSFEHIVRAGYIWVGISPQRVGVQQAPNGLKLWSPTRYGSLDVTAGGTVTDDALSYDIFAQGMQAIEKPQGVNVLGGAIPRHIIAMGASQSASRLGTYINSLHKELGAPVDAYILMIGGAKVREDLNVPVFKILSETDVLGQVAQRQPDTNKFRSWEVAGASHSSRRTAMNSAPSIRRDNVTREAAVCTYPTYPRVPLNYVLSSLYDHLVRWIDTGAPPPTAPKVSVTGNAIDRDEHGNARGGIRLAEFSPATAINSGANAGTAFCRLYGRYEPFPDATIASLYPTHQAYVAQANGQTDANLRAGYILPPDAMQSRLRANQSIFGYGAPCAAACKAAQDLVDASYFYLALSDRRDRMIAGLSGVVRTIADGDRPGANKARATAKAQRDLNRFITDLQAMQRRGQITALNAEELTNQTNIVRRALQAA